MALLKKEDIKNAPDLKTETVPVPEWGGDMLVRGMTGAQRDGWEAEMLANNKDADPVIAMTNARAKLAQRTCINEDGSLFFGPEDLDWLGKKSAAALDRIVEVAQRLSKITKSDLDELTKNSKSAPSGASISA